MRTIHRDIASGFIISRDNKILLGKNRKGGLFEGSFVVPGGGIEEGETKEQGLKREILEETGINIDTASTIVEVNQFTGSHEKTLRDTAERVMVDMTFYDYKVELADNADAVVVTAGDDWSSPRWFAVDELAGVSVGDFTAVTLKKISFWPN